MNSPLDPARPGSSLRRGRALLAIAALATPMALLLGGGHAEAASYRFWSYWQAPAGQGWSFAAQGPASTLPRDGDVEGWRFAVSADAGTATNTPRVTASFSRICGGVARPEGTKRVALVVDYGIAAHAPAGESPPALSTYCVVVGESTRGVGVLLNAVKVRSSNGLVCGINGYPRSECAVVVKDPPPTATSAPPATAQSPGGSAASSQDAAARPGSARGSDSGDADPSVRTATAPAQSPDLSTTPPARTPPTVAASAPPSAQGPDRRAAPSTLDPTPVVVQAPLSTSAGTPTAVVVTALLLAGLGLLGWWRRRAAG